jgi:feruloyl esterase
MMREDARVKSPKKVRGRAVTVAVGTLAVWLAGGRPSDAASCESLAAVSLPEARIDVAQTVAAGAFQPAPGAIPNPANAPRFGDLPAFCRVVATARPKSAAPVTIEVWLPVSGWNGRLRGIGNDGFYNAAPVTLGGLVDGLRAGDVAVGSDGGRKGDASYILHQPEQLTNFSYRSAHEMTAMAKALAEKFYGKPPSFSAVAECAGRGAVGLSSSQRYPADYDAVAVGEFIGDSNRHFANQWWVWQALHQNSASTIPLDKLPMIQRAAIAACDADDGAIDGLIGDPPRCAFDPRVLQCKAGDQPDCLTAPQVTALQTIYAGARNPLTNARVAPPLMRGGETNWTPIVGPKPNPVSLDHFRYFVLRDPDWDYEKRPVNFDTDITAANRQASALPISLTNPDIRPFLARGGRLLLYAGWSDPFVPPQISVDYYERVVATVGKKAAESSVRLFMVPGLRNCAGTAGAENFAFDTMTILQQWKDSGTAPESFVARRFQNGTEVGTRLVCAYPDVAAYRGSGGVQDAASFACRAPAGPKPRPTTAP